MIISSPREIHSSLEEYSLSRLRAYKNADHVFQRLVELHELPQKHHKSARTVAEQVRACIVNAQEHFAAASAVSHATKALHLYYGVMNYALAISIYKGGGDYRMDKLRELHASHGLTLSMASSCNARQDFKTLIQGIRAKPMLRPQSSDSPPNAYGTFEVWRSQHREFPGATRLKRYSNTSGWYTVECVGKFVGNDQPPHPLPSAGVSLEQALRSIPALTPRLANLGIHSNLVGASFMMYLPDNQAGTLDIVLQPQPQFRQHVADFCKLMKFDEEALRYTTTKEYAYSARSYSIQLGEDATVRGKIELPPIVYSTSLISYLSSSGWDLGEFGAYYIALFIAGNIVRYYPDLWIPHIEADTEFSQVIEVVCNSAVTRISALAASELDREQIVAFEFDPGRG